MNVCDTMKQLNSERTDAFMHELYGNGAAENKERYEAVLKGYKEAFGDSEEVLLFSSKTIQTRCILSARLMIRILRLT